MIAKHQRIQSQTTYSQVLPVARAVIPLLNKALLACSSLKEKKKKEEKITVQALEGRLEDQTPKPPVHKGREEEQRPGKTPF